MRLPLSISLLLIVGMLPGEAVQKLPDPPEEDFQEDEALISDLVTESSELWVLLFFCLVLALALAVTLCPCFGAHASSASSRLSQLETPLFREKYVVSVWKLNNEGTVRVLRRKAIV